MEEKEILKLTEWEVANFHLPPVTTITLYEGSAPVEFIRSRIAGMIKKNPWLTKDCKEEHGRWCGGDGLFKEP